MAKKGNSKKSDKTAEIKPAETPAAKPGLGAYAAAVWQLAVEWIKKHKRLVLILFVIFLLCIGIFGYKAWQDTQEFTNDEMVIRVSRELNISSDANPAILDVTDEQKVSQPFLEGAKNGDKVLLYYKAGKSVLFRPSDDLVVRSGTFSVPDAKLFVRKGTSDDAKVAAIKQKLESIENTTIASQDSSTNQNYPKTVVINVTDRYNDTAQKIANELGATVMRLPKGESVPDADILIIVGNQ